MMQDFWETEHGKLLAAARRYLMAADVLRNTDEYKRGVMLFTPTLHLLAHGIELLLKANLVGSGLLLEDIRKSHGHKILSLWNLTENSMLRAETLVEAGKAWERARSQAEWPDDFSDGNPEALLLEYLTALNKLHTQESDYALRYISEDGSVAPRPHLLLDSFLAVSDLNVRQPRIFLSTP